MTLVRIVKNWDYPDLMQQTPAGAGMWDDIQFTQDSVETCDALVVLNHTNQSIKVKCPPQNVWALVQEPPVPEYRWLEKGFTPFVRVYTPDINLTGPRYIHSHGALPWHVGKSYDFLKNTECPGKHRLLSSIASREMGTDGKKARVIFLEALRQKIDFDLWGKGFTPIEEKWEALASYRYALAIENYSGPHYWTEKISDCFLAWTMPIYYGATNITDYFPPESLVQIDITRPEEAHTIITEAIQTNRWQKNLDAIAYARQLVLEKHQIFPFISRLFQQNMQVSRPSLIHIPANLPPGAQGHSKRKLHHFFKKIRSITRSLWVS